MIKTIGDGFMAAFPDPMAAVAAALDIQQRLAAAKQRDLRRTPVSVRIGIHRDTAVANKGDYIGRDVALCARIAAHAKGGEILVSDTVPTGTVPAGGGDVDFQPRGDAEFKGISGPVAIYEVVAQ